MTKRAKIQPIKSRPVRGRRQTVQEATPDRRKRILDAALALFSAGGFDAIGTKRVAEEAAVPVSLVFYYFKTKENILDALLMEHSLAEAVKQAYRLDCFDRPISRREVRDALSAGNLRMLK